MDVKVLSQQKLVRLEWAEDEAPELYPGTEVPLGAPHRIHSCEYLVAVTPHFQPNGAFEYSSLKSLAYCKNSEELTAIRITCKTHPEVFKHLIKEFEHIAKLLKDELC